MDRTTANRPVLSRTRRGVAGIVLVSLIVASCSTTGQGPRRASGTSTRPVTPGGARAPASLDDVRRVLTKAGFKCEKPSDEGLEMAMNLFGMMGQSVDPLPTSQLDCDLDGDALNFVSWTSSSGRVKAGQAIIDISLALPCADENAPLFRTLEAGTWLAVPQVSTGASFSTSFSTDSDATTVPSRASSTTAVSAKAIKAAARALDVEPVTQSCGAFLKRLEASQPDGAPQDLATVSERLSTAGFTCKAAGPDDLGPLTGGGTEDGEGEATTGDAAGRNWGSSVPTSALTCSRDGVDMPVVGWGTTLQRVNAVQLIAMFSLFGCGSQLRAMHMLQANGWAAIVAEKSGSSPGTVAGVVRSAAKVLGVDPGSQECPKAMTSPTSSTAPGATTIVAPTDAPRDITGALDRLKQAGFTCQVPPTEQQLDDPTSGPHWMSACSYGGMDFDVRAWDDHTQREAAAAMALDPFFNAECRKPGATTFRLIAAGSWQLSADPDVGFDGDGDWTALDAKITDGMEAASKALAVPVTTPTCQD